MQPIRVWSNYSYFLLGLLNLAIALLITMGVGLSSSRLSSEMMFFVDFPLFVGIFGSFVTSRFLQLATLLGCISILVYIGWCTRGNLRGGYSILPFHMFWVCLNLLLVGMAIIKIARPRRIEV
jgi:hypothetical protein